MIVLHIVNLFICFLIVWFASYYYAGPIFHEQELSEWITYIMSSNLNFIFTFGLLVGVIFLLDFPRKKILRIFVKNLYKKKTYLLEAIILFSLLFAVYLYIYLKFGWYLILPILFYIILRGIFIYK